MAETPWLPTATWNQVNDAMPEGQKLPDKAIQLLDERDRSIIFPDNTADVHPYPASFRIAATTLAQPGGYTYASQTFTGLTAPTGGTTGYLAICLTTFLSVASSHTADHWLDWKLYDGSSSLLSTFSLQLKMANGDGGSYNENYTTTQHVFATAGKNLTNMSLLIEAGISGTLTYNIDFDAYGTLSWVGTTQTLT